MQGDSYNEAVLCGKSVKEHILMRLFGVHFTDLKSGARDLRKAQQNNVPLLSQEQQLQRKYLDI